MIPKHKFTFAIVSLVVGTFVALVLALFATLSVGNSFGVLTLAVWVCVVFQLITTLKYLKDAEVDGFHPAPLYLICLPVLTLISQLLLAAPITVWSKERAITNASEFIRDIENYHYQHSRYPVSLQAQNKDYYPAVEVIGLEWLGREEDRGANGAVIARTGVWSAARETIESVVTRSTGASPR
jgi:hypothetical protein